MAEICRELRISQQTFYRWRRKSRGMGMAELNRLKELERENKRLKQLDRFTRGMSACKQVRKPSCFSARLSMTCCKRYNP